MHRIVARKEMDIAKSDKNMQRSVVQQKFKTKYFTSAYSKLKGKYLHHAKFTKYLQTFARFNRIHEKKKKIGEGGEMLKEQM